jgi:hypothetical protein
MNGVSFESSLLESILFFCYEQKRCCGSVSYADWSATDWYKSVANHSQTVPDSCCKTPSVGCATRINPNNIFSEVSMSESRTPLWSVHFGWKVTALHLAPHSQA